MHGFVSINKVEGQKLNRADVAKFIFGDFENYLYNIMLTGF